MRVHNCSIIVHTVCNGKTNTAPRDPIPPHPQHSTLGREWTLDYGDAGFIQHHLLDMPDCHGWLYNRSDL